MSGAALVPVGGMDGLIAHYGGLALFIGSFFEGEAVAITGGALAHHQVLTFQVVVACVAAGAWVSDQTFFVIGRRFSQRTYVRRQLARPALRRVLSQIETRPYLVAPFFRFVPGFRIATPLMLAQTGIGYLPYALITLFSAVVWAGFYTTIGHAVGVLLVNLTGRFHRADVIVLVGLVLAVVLWWHARRRSKGRAGPLPQHKSLRR